MKCCNKQKYIWSVFQAWNKWSGNVSYRNYQHLLFFENVLKYLWNVPLADKNWAHPTCSYNMRLYKNVHDLKNNVSNKEVNIIFNVLHLSLDIHIIITIFIIIQDNTNRTYMFKTVFCSLQTQNYSQTKLKQCYSHGKYS